MRGEDTPAPVDPADAPAADRFRQLADSLPHVVWTAAADGTIDFQSARVRDFDGAAFDADGRWDWERIVHPDHAAASIDIWRRALAEGSAYERAHLLRMRDGSYRWHLSRARPTRDAAGRITGWCGTATDIDDLRRAEEALRSANATFRHLVQSSPFGLYVVDADFRLVEVSAGAQKVFENVRPLLGRDFAEVLRVVWPEPFASEAIGRFRHTLATGEPYSAPDTVETRRDIGVTEAYDWRIERIALPDARPGVLCHFYDLSERQRYEAALRDSERRASSIVESISDGFVTLDGDWRITYVNSRGREMVRPLFGAGDPVGQSFLDAIPRTPGTPFLNAYRRAMDDKVAANVEAYYAPLGSWFDVRCYPMADGLAIHFLDIGPRKRAEEALRESEERFRTVADNLPLMVWMHDADGRLEFVNQTYCDFFGVTRDEMRDDRWRVFVDPADGAAYAAAFEASVRERRAFHAEARVRRADGASRWVESWARPRFAADGTFLGHVGTSADITGRRRTEEIRQLLILELNHRVKNTLAVVQAIAHQSLRSGRSPGEQRDAFEGRLRALAAAHDVLTGANWLAASLGEIVAGTRRACGIAPERFAADGPDVTLAPQRAVTLAMALHELCTNAIKHGALSVPGGRVDVSWQTMDAPRRFRLSWTEQGGPAVAPPARLGFGSRMIERALAADLDASVRTDYAPTGLVCVIEAALPSGEAGA